MRENAHVYTLSIYVHVHVYDSTSGVYTSIQAIYYYLKVMFIKIDV